MSDTSGRMCGKQFATYDPDTSSWKMWPDIGLWGSIEYSGTWPKTGYMRDGSVFELPMSGPVIDESGCSSSQLLPTPRATDGTKGGPNQRGSSGDLMLPSAVHLLPTVEAKLATNWGDYEPAIRRAEQAMGEPAPPPTEPSSKGNPRLSAAFAEWMMGLPAGHVTAVPGLSRNEQLKALGNGVVPAQALHALMLLNRIAVAS